jgi:hypothetical protein
MTTLSRQKFFPGLSQALRTGAMLLLAGSAGAGLPTVPPELERVRAAMEKYQDPYVAVRDGYFSTVACINFPRSIDEPGRLHYGEGAMGIHFLNPQLVGPVPDPMRPPILLYEPDGGKLRLVGVEWFVPLATGVKERPVLFGQPFDGPMEGHEPILPVTLHHYDLHTWLWKENPNGLFSGTNPAVKCAGYEYTVVEEHAPHIVAHPK